MINQRVECRACDGTGEGHNGRACSACRGRGERFVAIPHDDSLCAMEGEELPPTEDEILAADPFFVTVCDERRDCWVASIDAALTLAAAA